MGRLSLSRVRRLPGFGRPVDCRLRDGRRVVVLSDARGQLAAGGCCVCRANVRKTEKKGLLRRLELGFPHVR